jgi:DNA-binding NarL/FixJ family response regulator
MPAEPPPRVVLIEFRHLFRICFEHLFFTFFPHVSVESISAPREIDGPARLLLLGLSPGPQFEKVRLLETIDMMRRLGSGSPIGVYLHGDDAAMCDLLLASGVAGILLPSAGLEMTIAAVHLMLVGGTFFPPEVLRRCREQVSGDPFAEGPMSVCAKSKPIQPNVEGQSTEELTDRERDVLNSLRSGQQNKNIAYELGISESTVKVHLRSIMKKLRATNRTQVAMLSSQIEGS